MAGNGRFLGRFKYEKKYDIGSKMQYIVVRSTVWLHNPHRTKGLCSKLQKALGRSIRCNI